VKGERGTKVIVVGEREGNKKRYICRKCNRRWEMDRNMDMEMVGGTRL
jgi:transposase-like protein